MRLIDADALKKAIDIPWLDNIRLGKIINDAPTIEANAKCVARVEIDTEELVKRIKEEYDIIDEDQIVRCKDCKYWNNRHSGVTYCHRLGVCMTKADDYCSMGERGDK